MRQIVILLVFLVSFPALASFRGRCQITKPSAIHVDLNSDGQMELVQISHHKTMSPAEEAEDPFREDWFELMIEDAKGTVLHKETFASSYETFRLTLLDLAGNGKPMFVFELSQGRGNFAVETLLLVKQWNGVDLTEVFRMPTNRYIGPPCGKVVAPGLICNKEVTFLRDKKAHRWYIRFLLKCDENCPGTVLDPKDRDFLAWQEQTLEWDAATHQLVLVNRTQSKWVRQGSPRKMENKTCCQSTACIPPVKTLH